MHGDFACYHVFSLLIRLLYILKSIYSLRYYKFSDRSINLLMNFWILGLNDSVLEPEVNSNNASTVYDYVVSCVKLHQQEQIALVNNT
jgi:hypothetical protein